MANISKLANYYKKCLYEEAKVSAFSNLDNDENTVIMLSDDTDSSADLTNVSLRAALDKSKQLLYGYKFLKGKLLDGTNIYTPLFYSSCKLERECGVMKVCVENEAVSINLPALIQLVPNNDDKDMLIQQLVKMELSFPMEAEAVDNVLGILKDSVNILGTLVNIEDSKAVILTTINKGLAGVINELSAISNMSEAFLSSPSAGRCKVFPSALNLNKSQRTALEKACTDEITAIAGPPGTGKSHVIAAIAYNYILNGKSVLVCSKQNSAVDVLYNKISSISNAPFCVRTGGKEYRTAIMDQVDKILTDKTGVENAQWYDKRIERFYHEVSVQERLDALTEKRRYLTESYADAYNHDNGMLKDFRYFFKGMKLNYRLAEIDDMRTSVQMESVEDTDLGKLAEMAVDAFVNLKLGNAQTNTTIRRNLLTFAKALKKGGIEQLGSSSRNLFQMLVDNVFPCWCTTAVDVSASIPLVKNLFDVVIIDEASQCDIATCLPLLFRAKSAVVVGDDKQLKYISFIPTMINNANMKSSGLTPEDTLLYNYRECSMFDYATYSADSGSTLLDVQYRGNYVLMGFSNKKFYHDCVSNTVGCQENDYARVIDCADAKLEKGKTINKVEIGKAIKIIRDAMKTEGDAETPLSIGVLSPFKDQVKALEKAIYEEFTTEEIAKHDILVGTAHSFQGAERDLMILSWTVTEDSPIQQFTFLNNPNLFNVAITRANKRVMNLVSAKTNLRGLLKEYIEYCKNYEVKLEVNPLDI